MTEQDPGPPDGQPAVEAPPGQPGIYVPVEHVPAAEMPAAAPRKSIVLPAVLTVAMVLAAGAFVALWLVERGDHKATTGQLNGVRAEITEVEKKTGAALTAHSDAEKRLKEAETGLAEKKAEADKHKPCSDAGRELYAATDGRAIGAAIFLVMERCK